jgi:hypothetical protein
LLADALLATRLFKEVRVLATVRLLAVALLATKVLREVRVLATVRLSVFIIDAITVVVFKVDDVIVVLFDVSKLSPLSPVTLDIMFVVSVIIDGVNCPPFEMNFVLLFGSCDHVGLKVIDPSSSA